MKSFTEALAIFEANVEAYKKTCEKSNGKVLKNYQAYFINLMPFSKHHGGITGYNKAIQFLKKLREYRNQENVFQTQDLIKFAIENGNMGETFSEYIWQSIREVAGFNQEHVNYLAHMYATKTGPRDKWDKSILNYSSKDAQMYAKKLIHLAISGNYHRNLIQYLNNNLGLNSECLTQLITTHTCREEDFGQKLLIGLNSKLMQQQEIATIEIEKSQNRM